MTARTAGAALNIGSRCSPSAGSRGTSIEGDCRAGRRVPSRWCTALRGKEGLYAVVFDREWSGLLAMATTLLAGAP